MKNTFVGGGISPQGRYESFDGLRAFAAIGILLMHYLANIGKDVSGVLKETSVVYDKLIPFYYSFVYLFFIVSAFSMCCGYYKRFEVDENRRSGFDCDGFYKKRYSRIWPFFALLVMIDFCMSPSVDNLYQVIADLTLAFNLLPNPTISVIGVGWFLGVIFLFYMIFPWYRFLIGNKRRAWFVFTVSVLFHFAMVSYFFNDNFCLKNALSQPQRHIVFIFPLFVIGGLLYLYRDKLAFTKLWQKLILLCLGITIYAMQFIFDKPMVLGENFWFITIIFTLWVMYAMTGGIAIKGVKLLDNKVMKFIGGISMEIYLCHMVMFRVVEKVHLERFIENPHLLYWTWCAVGIAAAIVFSWVVKNWVFPTCSKVIEKIK